MQNLKVQRNDIEFHHATLIPVEYEKKTLILIFDPESHIIFSYNPKFSTQRYKRFGTYFKKQKMRKQLFFHYVCDRNKQYIEFSVLKGCKNKTKNGSNISVLFENFEN